MRQDKLAKLFNKLDDLAETNIQSIPEFLIKEFSKNEDFDQFYDYIVNNEPDFAKKLEDCLTEHTKMKSLAYSAVRRLTSSGKLEFQTNLLMLAMASADADRQNKFVDMMNIFLNGLKNKGGE